MDVLEVPFDFKLQFFICLTVAVPARHTVSIVIIIKIILKIITVIVHIVQVRNDVGAEL